MLIQIQLQENKVTGYIYNINKNKLQKINGVFD